MAKKDSNFNNDWEALIAKPENPSKKNFSKDEEPDPFRQKREDTYYSLFPSDSGEKYAFAIVPDSEGKSFLMTDIATIQRWRFTSPKDGKHYFENLKMPMDPKYLFDMSIMDRLSDLDKFTEADKAELKRIKRHSDLIQRYKDLQYAKVKDVNFGYSPKPSMFNNRLKKVALTAFFGTWTKWKGVDNSHNDRAVKLITSTHTQFQDKFRALLKSTDETHRDLQPSWYEDYFSSNGGVKGIIDVKMGSMKVGGEGATVKLIKIGKDPIDDKGVGVTGPISEKDIIYPSGEENKLSHLHFYLGMKSDGSLYHDIYADRFEEAIVQLESHLNEMKLKSASTESESTSDETKSDLPF